MAHFIRIAAFIVACTYSSWLHAQDFGFAVTPSGARPTGSEGLKLRRASPRLRRVLLLVRNRMYSQFKSCSLGDPLHPPFDICRPVSKRPKPYN